MAQIYCHSQKRFAQQHRLYLVNPCITWVAGVAGGFCAAVPARKVFSPVVTMPLTRIWMLSKSGNRFVFQILAFLCACIIGTKDQRSQSQIMVTYSYVSLPDIIGSSGNLQSIIPSKTRLLLDLFHGIEVFFKLYRVRPCHTTV